MSDMLFEKLKQIKALAESGVDGEREAAERKLRMLCAKHGVRLEDLAEESKAFYKFKFDGELERHLFVQCLVCVCQTNEIRHRKGPRWIACELTAEQAVRLGECWDHYRKEWRREKAATLLALLKAMINQHDLFGPQPKDESDVMPRMSEEERRRVHAMMRGLGTQQWSNQRRIAE